MFDSLVDFGGQSYFVEECVYKPSELREHLDEFSPAKARERLVRVVKEKAGMMYDDKKDRAICLIDPESKEKVLVLGNAMLVALMAKEYGIVRELVGSCMLEDGRTIRFNEEPFVAVKEEKFLCLLELLMKPNRLPEDIRVLLLETLAEQNRGVEKYMADIKWPSCGNLSEALLWSKELFSLKKYPKLYEQLMTEEFICDYIWLLSAWYGAGTKQEKIQIIKKLKPIAGHLTDAEAMWSVVKKHKSNEFELYFSSGWYEVRDYMELWKKVTGQPICLSVKGDPYWKKCTGKNADVSDTYSFSSFLSCVVEKADCLTDTNSLKPDKLFEYFFREGKEAELLKALRINLITKNRIPKAMKYAEEKQQIWAVPLLMLKQHDAFEDGGVA